MDGFELLAALRSHEETRTIPVVMLSARADEEAKIEELVMRADDYLVTYRRKNDVSSGPRVVPDRSGALPECALGLPRAFSVARAKFFFPRRRTLYPFLRLAKTLPILMSVSATTPNPTHRSIPSSPR
jgi:hypothetical protein